MCTCVRCATAYHSGDFCTAAGSKMLDDATMLCTAHLPASVSAIAHCNVNWCFLCCQGRLFVLKVVCLFSRSFVYITNFCHFVLTVILCFMLVDVNVMY